MSLHHLFLHDLIWTNQYNKTIIYSAVVQQLVSQIVNMYVLLKQEEDVWNM